MTKRSKKNEWSIQYPINEIVFSDKQHEQHVMNLLKDINVQILLVGLVIILLFTSWMIVFGPVEKPQPIPQPQPAPNRMTFALEKKSEVPQGEYVETWELANNQKATMVAARHFVYWINTKKDNIEINSMTTLDFNDDGTTSSFIIVYRELKTSTLGKQ